MSSMYNQGFLCFGMDYVYPAWVVFGVCCVFYVLCFMFYGLRDVLS